jgi:glucose/arabinose dehydrogenase/mono/diheme cytochrome c family protein
MCGASLFVGLLPLAAAAPSDDQFAVEAGGVRPGLVAEYRSVGDPTAAVRRVETKPTFYLDRSSPHPRLPLGPFEVVWSGTIAIKDPGPLRFSALVGGEVTMTVDGATVLAGTGLTDVSRLTGKEPLRREPGNYALSIRYRSLAGVPARVQLWWEGPTFAAEPIPAWRFGHVPEMRSPAVESDELAARGKIAAGQFGCARCHAGALPAVSDPPPGPSLADAGRRLDRTWLLQWLADPAKFRPGAHMPSLFSSDRSGFVERWIVADYLTRGGKRAEDVPTGDHRRGRITFVSVGCAACHVVPDVDLAQRPDPDRVPFTGLADRMCAADLATFLGNPHGRYPDGRMPRLPVTPDEARDIAAFLLLWSKRTDEPPEDAPKADELQEAFRRLGARDTTSAAATLLHDKGCSACHTGLGESKSRDVPIRTIDGGCPTGKTGPQFSLPAETQRALAAYLSVAPRERHPSPFTDRQHRLVRAGCVRCHQRDTDRPPPIEAVGGTLGGAHLQEVPFLRTPRLTNPHQKFTRSYLATTVREGASGLRWSRYTYRMPAFGPAADELVQALAEADGELLFEPDRPAPAIDDPTLGTVHGPQLAGSQGYGCASCHVWNGRLLASPDPIATGPDLTRTAGRLRRDWFDRYLDGPHRFYPGTPMPAVFTHGKPATLPILDGSPARQKDALWAYFARGKDAPAPAPPPPLPIEAPAAGEPFLVAQIPIRLPDGRFVESITLLTGEHDLLIYDLAVAAPHTFLVGGQILRTVQGRLRQFLASGTVTDLTGAPAPQLLGLPKGMEISFTGYDRLPDGVRLRWQFRSGNGTIEAEETVRVVNENGSRRLVRELRASDGRKPVTVRKDLPAAKPAPAWEGTKVNFPDAVDGTLERPGFRAVAYPRPKTISGEDRVMPVAVTVRPRDGQVFVASLKTGELFALRDPTGDGKQARFENYTHGLYQDALSLRAEDDSLYVLHRRNLTRIPYRDGPADRFDRVAALPHGVADTYDMAYGLTRDRRGRFVFGYAPYANAGMAGSGGVLALQPGNPPEEVAFGLRNALGWCSRPDGEVFFTDNQGDWVASNKLCHVESGKYYGWPNPAQRQHAMKPAGKAAVWVPYAWARSINGVAYDETNGRFGPFAGQFFMAELMFGGGIVRANVEKVNGVYQGACFPFWGKGLLGPVSLAFDPKGHLYVGGITEPGWMAQPDRGALFRIDYTGQIPFEMQSIHVRPRGFRVTFTSPVDRATAAKPTSYQLEHYRYEYTGAYGSPELDRTAVKVGRAEVAADGRSVELTVGSLTPDRVYLLTAAGVRSERGESLVQPTGAYTLNEMPKQ